MAQGPSDTILVAIRITLWIRESKVRNPDPLDWRRFVLSEHSFLVVCCVCSLQCFIRTTWWARDDGVAVASTLNHMQIICTSRQTDNYKGRSINKLHNGLILSISSVWKIWNIHFVGNLTANIGIIVTSVLLWTQSIGPVICSTVFLHDLPSVNLHRIVSYEKNKEVQKTNCLLFIFQCIIQIHLIICPWWGRMKNVLLQKLQRSLRQQDGQVVVVSHQSSTTVSWPRANILQQTLVAGLIKYLSSWYYTESIWDNAICAKSLYRQKTTEHRSSRDAFHSNAIAFSACRWRHSDVTIMKLRPGGRN